MGGPILAALVGQGVEVRRSGLPDAGNGLFATRDFRRHELVTEYQGVELPASSIRELVTEQGWARASHTISLRGPTVLDGLKDPKAAVGRGGASFANDARCPALTNAAFSWRAASRSEPHKSRVFLRAKRDIAAGEEIFVSYGSDYWDVRGGV